MDASNAPIVAGDKVVSAGAGKVKKIAGTPAVADVLAVVGVAIAGCDADGVAFVKLTI